MYAKQQPRGGSWCIVVQAPTLPYCRFPIGWRGMARHAEKVGVRRLEALRYSRLETCATIRHRIYAQGHLGGRGLASDAAVSCGRSSFPRGTKVMSASPSKSFWASRGCYKFQIVNP